MIWRCQLGKHEETVRVIYGLITDIVADLPLQLRNLMFSKVIEVPSQQYNELYLTFLKDFTQKAL